MLVFLPRKSNFSDLQVQMCFDSYHIKEFHLLRVPSPLPKGGAFSRSGLERPEGLHTYSSNSTKTFLRPRVRPSAPAVRFRATASCQARHGAAQRSIPRASPSLRGPCYEPSFQKHGHGNPAQPASRIPTPLSPPVSARPTTTAR